MKTFKKASLLTSYFILTLISSLTAQLDTLGFIHPVKHNIRISGNFGELRSNHFHSGIDIKSTKGVSGDSIIAIQSGYISRIKIQLAGYGKAVYIDHPSGHTSVYAHLISFSPKIDSFILSKQRELESYTLDLYLEAGQFEINQADLVGLMGNTGRSTAPHLHFEIRDTQSEEPMNPLLFGFDITDNIPPELELVSFYGLDKNKIPINTKSIKNFNTQDIYIDAWRTGLGIQAFDYIDGSWNMTGIYKSKITVDDSLVFESKFDRFSFNQTRFINACIDYKAKKDFAKKTLLCYRQPGNQLELYRQSAYDGIIELFKDTPRNVKLEISDQSENIKTYHFNLFRKNPVSSLPDRNFSHYINYDQVYTFEDSLISLNFPENTFYKDEMIDIKCEGNMPGSRLQVGNFKIPAHKFFNITAKLSDGLKKRDKLCIVYLDEGSVKSIGGLIDGHLLKASTNRMGRFEIRYDTIAPTLKWITKKSQIKSNKTIKVWMKDNLGALGQANDPSWKVTLNNEWIYSEFDIKTNLISFQIPKDYRKPGNVLKIQSSDDRNNVNVLEHTF